MKLITKRLILRQITMKDAKSIAENANDWEIWYFTERIPYPYKLKDAKFWIKNSKKQAKEKPIKNYNFGIELKSKKGIIGSIGVHNINRQHKKAVIGYWLGKKYRKQGITSEAEKAVLDFAFKRLKLNKIYGDALIENRGSNALFRKFDFRKVGVLKEELIKINKELNINKKPDAYKWELLRKDYKPRKSQIVERK